VLRYRLIPHASVDFADTAPAVEADATAFSVTLADRVATFEMREHHASEESAKRAVHPYLRAWEIQHALWAGRPEFTFESSTPRSSIEIRRGRASR
jgi:hypothetical protein